jgi:hypothetical protein
MAAVTGAPGELVERLVDLVESPGPHLRAVVTTLLIKALDSPQDELPLMEAMVASDDAAAMIDPAAAAEAAVELRRGLLGRLREMAAGYGEATLVETLRDHLSGQVERWAARAVDDAEGRRRAERFLAWAERPGQLEAAQRRGIFAGMDADDFRRLARSQAAAPESPEAALRIWTSVEEWRRTAGGLVGPEVIEEWRTAARPD